MKCMPGMSGVECISECKSTEYAPTQTGVSVSLTDGRSEPSVSNKFNIRLCSGLVRGKVIMNLRSIPAPRGSHVWHVRECAQSVPHKAPKHGRLLGLMTNAEGAACKCFMTNKSLEHGWRNKRNLALKVFPRISGVQYARYARQEQCAWRAQLGYTWENPIAQGQKFKNKFMGDRWMAEYLRGHRQLMCVRD